MNDDSNLNDIKDNCSNDMLKYIQSFLPMAIEVQFKIISKYGYTPDNEGIYADFIILVFLLVLFYDNYGVL